MPFNLRGFLAGATVLALLGLFLFVPLPRNNTYSFTSNDKSCGIRQDIRAVISIRSRSRVYRESDRVVRIYGSNYDTETGVDYIWAGTGGILDDGFILTSYHVVSGIEPLNISDGKNTYQGNLTDADPVADLAMVRYEPEERKFNGTRIKVNAGYGVNLITRTLDPSDGFYEGGEESKLQLSHRTLGAQVLDKNDGNQHYFDLILANSENDNIIPTMSGSHVFDNDGSLIGVVKTHVALQAQTLRPAGNKTLEQLLEEVMKIERADVITSSSDIVQFLKTACKNK